MIAVRYTKVGLSLFLFLLLSPFLLALPGSGWFSDFDKGLKLARKKGQPLLLDLYAPWCAYCRKLQKEIYPSSQVREFSQKFVRVRINGEKKKSSYGTL